MKHSTLKPLLPVILIFVVINLIILLVGKWLLSKNIDTTLLANANGLFFLINLIVFLLQKKALNHQNPNVFVRSIMAGMMIKMLVTVAAVFIYIYIAGQNFSKKSLFIALAMYLLYLGGEVISVMRLNNRNNG